MTAPIRLGEITDADILARVITDAFRAAERFFIETDRISPDGVRALFAKGVFLVAGDFAGTVYVELRGERAYFGMLAVQPGYQGNGIGGALIAAAEDYARAHRCRFMDIYVASLRTELPPVYRKLGYVECGREPWPEGFPTKMPCHLVRMEKAL